MQRNTFLSEKQWISRPLDKRCTTLVELGTDGTVQNPKKRRTFALEISDEHDKNDHLAVGSLLIRPKADYVCSQEHSKVSFQLLGMFPVTRKAPQTATLGIFLRSRDAVA